MAIEKSITNSIIAYIKQIGGQAEKVKGDASASGRPDINACYHGRCLRIEVKTPDHRNKTSKKQDINLKRWRYSGAVCMAIYSKKALVYFLTCLSMGKTGYINYVEDNNCESYCYIPKLNFKKRSLFNESN